MLFVTRNNLEAIKNEYVGEAVLSSALFGDLSLFCGQTLFNVIIFTHIADNE